MMTPLGEAVNQRRIQLGMTWRQLSTAAGLSVAGLSAIRRGDRKPSALATRRIELALGWAPGAVDTVLSGRTPRVGNDPNGVAAAVSAIRVRIADAQRTLDLLDIELDRLHARLDNHGT